MSDFASYVICTSPRSGSTLLCRLLRDAHVAGHPGSHFHRPSLNGWLAAYDLSRADYATETDAVRAVFAAGFAHGTGQGDIFGLRMQGHSFEFFATKLASLFPDLPDTKTRINAAFGKTLFVHLTRSNKLDQAISYVKAQQSGLWHRAPDGTEIERLSEPKKLNYDAEAIAAQIAEFNEMDTAWLTWFANDGIAPLTIPYDALSEDPFRERDRLLDALGVAVPEDEPRRIPVARLSDAINVEWASRFRAEHPSLFCSD